ncbi:transcription factor HES-1 [Python bivittatus]|uniref:Transcription factor HES-1 n=1 Tax=Python bivittatus TaxID=176946 RepID=A0A9F5N102_PYTBI|nr:transcription factor HES-1 [Python bivittatus]
MTVKHLRSLQRAQMTAALNTDPTVLCKYRAGFNECMNEVTRFLSTCEGVNTEPLRPTAVRSSHSTPTGDWAQAFPLPLPPSPQDPVPHRSQQTRSGDPAEHGSFHASRWQASWMLVKMPSPSSESEAGRVGTKQRAQQSPDPPSPPRQDKGCFLTVHPAGPARPGLFPGPLPLSEAGKPRPPLSFACALPSTPVLAWL